MSVEELRAGFARLAGPVVAREDPYGRLLRRAQRSRRARLAGWLSGLAAALVAVLVTPLLVQSSGAPTPTVTPSPGVDDLRGAAISPWVQTLLDTPVRGSLARDGQFLSALTDGLTPLDFGFSPELNRRTVLFADDRGGYRMVLLAFHSASNQMAVWLIGDAGEGAQQMAADAAADRARQMANPDVAGPIRVLPEELRPVTATAITGPGSNRYLAVAVAPHGCRMEVNDEADPAHLRDSADTDFVVLTDPFDPSQASAIRVTCDGTVRQRGPLTNGARIDLAPIQPTQQQLDAALVGTRGTHADLTQVRFSLSVMLRRDFVVADSCRVLYAGRLPATVEGGATGPDSAAGDPPVLALACATSHGNTAFEVDASTGAGLGGNSRVKFTDPHAIMVMAAPKDTSTHEVRSLVLAPPSATLLQVLTAGQVSQSVPLTAGVGSLVVAEGQTVQLRALDAAGAVVGSGTGPMGDNIPEESPPDLGPIIDNWS